MSADGVCYLRPGPLYRFQYPRNLPPWEKTIPMDTDILVTHAPPVRYSGSQSSFTKLYIQLYAKLYAQLYAQLDAQLDTQFYVHSPCSHILANVIRISYISLPAVLPSMDVWMR